MTQEKVLVAFSENILFTKNWEANPDFPEFFFPSTKGVLNIMGIFILSWEFKDGVAVTSQRRLVTPSNPYFY